MLNRNVEKEAVNVLLQENRRLKRENQRLRESLDELDGYKNEYRGLIKEMSGIKETYAERMEGFSQLEDECRKALDTIVGNGSGFSKATQG